MNVDPERLLSRIEQPDRLVPALEDGPALFDEIAGVRPHRSAVHRYMARGSHGVLLGHVFACGRRLTSARMIAEFVCASAQARLAKRAASPSPARRTIRRGAASGRVTGGAA